MDYVRNKSLDNKFVIFSDSFSVLKSLNHTQKKKKKNTSKNRTQNLIDKHHALSKTKEILFCWHPSHVSIRGNETADVKAKSSLDLDISNIKIPFMDLKLLSTGTSYPMSWDRVTFNKLHEIKPVLSKKNTIYRSLRRSGSYSPTYWLY